ncbi:hypothetical protein JHD50_02285 [Sulfurimonas sp. MAG313]|nr:hypothetical protein [Sulfurimonas sp. MAG313]
MNIQSTKGIFETIEKILMVLKQPNQDFMKEKIPKEIKNWIANFDKELEKGDIVFSKSFQTQISKLKNFFAPSQILENKLLQENLQKDLKALLIGLEKEVGSLSTNNATEVLKSVDKLLLQVDYFQLLSHLSNASYLYLPYSWEGLENGKFSFKSKKDGSCYCEIDLELKNYGSLNMMLQLFEDTQLNINIYTQDKELQKLFKTHIKDLKEALIKVNIMPRNIQIFSLKEHPRKHLNYKNDSSLDELGFEVKG